MEATTQHQGNLDQLAMNERQLTRNAKQLVKNRRYLKWFGWFPLAFMVRDATEELVFQDGRLRAADLRLRTADENLQRLEADHGAS